jgi:hypothetical protein
MQLKQAKHDVTHQLCTHSCCTQYSQLIRGSSDPQWQRAGQRAIGTKETILRSSSKHPQGHLCPKARQRRVDPGWRNHTTMSCKVILHVINVLQLCTSSGSFLALQASKEVSFFLPGTVEALSSNMLSKRRQKVY